MPISHSLWGGMTLEGLSCTSVLPRCPPASKGHLSPGCTLGMGWENCVTHGPRGHLGGMSPLSTVILMSPEDN